MFLPLLLGLLLRVADEAFCTEAAAKEGVTFENTSLVEPLVVLRYFGPDVNPDAPALGDYRRNGF